MTKYIIGEIFTSGGATLYKNPSDETVYQTIYKIATHFIFNTTIARNCKYLKNWFSSKHQLHQVHFCYCHLHTKEKCVRFNEYDKIGYEYRLQNWSSSSSKVVACNMYVGRSQLFMRFSAWFTMKKTTYSLLFFCMYMYHVIVMVFFIPGQNDETFQLTRQEFS